MILDNEIKDSISTYFETMKKFAQLPNFPEVKVDLQNLNESWKYLVRDQLKTIRSVNKCFCKELSLYTLLVFSVTALKNAMSQDNDNLPIPHDWLDKKEYPDPNLIVEKLLIQIINQTISIISLCKIGLDPSARVLMRTLIELSWITIIVSADKDIMAIYCQTGNNESTTKQVWHKYFTPKKLNENLTEIEKKLGLTEENLESLTKHRRGIYSFYSEYLHNQYMASMASTLAFPMDQSDEVNSRIFGMITPGIKNTLGHVNWNLFFLLVTLIRVFRVVHKWNYPMKNQLWIDALALKECAVETYLKSLKKKKST